MGPLSQIKSPQETAAVPAESEKSQGISNFLVII